MKLTDEYLEQGAAKAAELFDRSYPNTDEVVEFSPRFERDMRYLVAMQKKSRKRNTRRWLAAAACLSVLVSFGVTQTGQATLTALLQRITFVQEESRTLTYQSTEETTHTFLPMAPTTLPPELEQTEQYDSEHLRIREYAGENGEYLRYEQEYAGGTRFRYELGQAETLTIGDDTHAIYTDDPELDTRMLVWINGTSRLLLTGNLEKETMLAIANSVK